MEELDEVKSALDAIPVDKVKRGEWIEVGMACKEIGTPLEVWEEWSSRDSRPGKYKPGECARKWKGFKGSSTPVGKKRIFDIAKRFGWSSTQYGHCKGWDDPVSDDGIPENHPPPWNPVDDLKTYLSVVFDPDDLVSYSTSDAWKHDEDDEDEDWKPGKGFCDRTAGELIESLEKHPDNISDTVGTWKEDCGAWIRPNPVNGNNVKENRGVKDEDITKFRYALVESDAMTIPEQRALYDRMQLPIVALVQSGGKSVHAITHIDASSPEEYAERVNRLYSIMAENGMVIDENDKNPSRLSRMPGITRNGNRQQLLATNIGKRNWSEWIYFIENEYTSEPENNFLSLFQTLDMFPEEEADWLIEGWIPAEQITLLASEGGTGKTSTWINLLAGLSSGNPTIFDLMEEEGDDPDG